jgi:hypothetical protein
MITREQLKKEYLVYRNEYLSIELFAEHRGLTVDEAKLLIKLAKSCLDNSHPES